MKKNFLSIKDLSKEEILEIFDMASLLKEKPLSKSSALKNKIIGLIFQKPSNRTRLSFEVGSIQLGGHAIYIAPEDIKFGEREPIKDISRVLSRYLNLVILRTFRHNDIMEFAKYATVPVINGLSDLLHPCQALSDIFTIKEKLRGFKNKILSFVGDANNVLHSLLYCSSKVGLNMKIATPKGFQPEWKILQEARGIAAQTGSKIDIYQDAGEAIKDADIVYTDVWVSMGQEKQRAARLKAFGGFQVNAKLISLAKKNAIIMHCLPAHRGEEITDEIIESKNSIVFEQAENRLHVQKALMLKLTGE